MKDEFIKMLQEKLKEQGGPKHGPEMQAKASIFDSMSKVLGKDLNDSAMDSLKEGKDVIEVRAASNSRKKLGKALGEVEDMLEGESEEDESEEDESVEDESEKSEDESESLKSEIEMLKREIENLKKR